MKIQSITNYWKPDKSKKKEKQCVTNKLICVNKKQQQNWQNNNSNKRKNISSDCSAFSQLQFNASVYHKSMGTVAEAYPSLSV